MIIYEVKANDSLFSISQQYGIPVKKIISDNDLPPEELVVGQALVLLPESRPISCKGANRFFPLLKKTG